MALAGGAVVLLGSMLASPQLFAWGGVFDVHEPDLRAKLGVECGTPGAGLPDRISLHYEWSWTASSPMPSGTDLVILGWTAADSQGHPLYVIDTIPDSGAGVYSGLTGYPSTQMGDNVARETPGAFRWAIPLDEQQFAAGRIELHLHRSEAAVEEPQPQPLVVKATYIHLGLWRQSPATITCTW